MGSSSTGHPSSNRFGLSGVSRVSPSTGAVVGLVAVIVLPVVVVAILASESLRLLVVGILLLGLLWAVLLGPVRRWCLESDERTAFRWFVAAHAVVPLAVYWIGSKSQALFSSGWDAESYHAQGLLVADQLEFLSYSTVHRRVPGTGAVDLAVGYLYHFAGSGGQLLTTYLWSGLTALGVLVFWLSTRALVDNKRLYAWFLLFTPTVLFWGSNLGKEPLIVLGIGCFVGAASRVVSGQEGLRAVAMATVAFVTLGYVRPHIALVAVVSLLFGAVFMRRPRNRSAGFRRGVLIAVPVVLFVVLLPLVGSLLNVESGESVLDAAYTRADATAGGLGDSAYESSATRSVTDVPAAVATVMFRPWPWEVSGPFQALASLEAVIAMVLLVKAVRRRPSRGGSDVRTLMPLLSIAFIVLFSVVVATYGNFGLLVRQRMQVWPFVIFLIFFLSSSLQRPDDRVAGSSDGEESAPFATRHEARVVKQPAGSASTATTTHRGQAHE